MSDRSSSPGTRVATQRVPEGTPPRVERHVTGVAYLALITVIKPHEKHSLHIPATVDRVIEGDIVRIEKGVQPKMIVHTRNTFTLPLKADVPVKLFLSPFKDGHGH